MLIWRARAAQEKDILCSLTLGFEHTNSRQPRNERKDCLAFYTKPASHRRVEHATRALPLPLRPSHPRPGKWTHLWKHSNFPEQVRESCDKTNVIRFGAIRAICRCRIWPNPCWFSRFAIVIWKVRICVQDWGSQWHWTTTILVVLMPYASSVTP